MFKLACEINCPWLVFKTSSYACSNLVVAHRSVMILNLEIKDFNGVHTSNLVKKNIYII